MRTVVVTGLGMVSPLVTGVEESWSRLVAGQSGAGMITRFDASEMPCRIACEVKRGDGSDGTFDVDRWVEYKEQRSYDTFMIYALAAAKQAVADSGWEAKSDDDKYATGVLIGSGIGGLPSIETTTLA